jgi:hypothetical protein
MPDSVVVGTNSKYFEELNDHHPKIFNKSNTLLPVGYEYQYHSIIYEIY